MSCKEYIYIVKPQDIIKDPCFQKVTEMLLLYATLKKNYQKQKCVCKIVYPLQYTYVKQFVPFDIFSVSIQLT